MNEQIFSLNKLGTNSLENRNISANQSKFLKSGTLRLSFPIITDTIDQNSADYAANEEIENNKKIFLDADNRLIRSDIKKVSLSNEPNHNLEISNSESSNVTTSGKQFAPLVGFVPVHASFQPADNEVWMELERESSTIRIFKGKEKLKEIVGKGKISLAPGEYPLQHKQKNPLWYAPDEYFEKRQLKIPPRGDHFRYRRGALGNYAIYPTMDFIIHSGPFISEEIGGLKVSDSDLSSIFSLINISSPIIVK
jgi:hypothetical protein